MDIRVFQFHNKYIEIRIGGFTVITLNKSKARKLKKVLKKVIEDIDFFIKTKGN